MALQDVCGILDMIGRRRMLVKCPYAWPAIALVSLAALRAAEERGGALVLHGGRFRPHLLYRMAERMGLGDVVDSVIIAEETIPLENQLPVAVMDADILAPSVLEEAARRVVLATASRLGPVSRIIRAGKVIISRMSPGLYRFKWGSHVCVARMGEAGLFEPVIPTGVEGRALRTLLRGIAEYGVLSIRDAVDLVSTELGLPRTAARRIIGRLASKGFIVVEGGQVHP